MTAQDGKERETDCCTTDTVLRIFQSIPSPKAEPFKRWLAQVGSERLDEIENPEIAAKRMREIYKAKGYSEFEISYSSFYFSTVMKRTSLYLLYST